MKSVESEMNDQDCEGIADSLKMILADPLDVDRVTRQALVARKLLTRIYNRNNPKKSQKEIVAALHGDG